VKIKIIENRKKFFTFSTILVVLALKTIGLKELNPILDEIAKEIPQLDNNSRKVQISDGNVVIIRTPEMSENIRNNFMKNLKGKAGKYDLLRSDKVGASIGQELKSTAIIALLVGLFLIVGYITIRFEFKFALAAVAVGGIALLGYEVNTPFIAAVLTILGYSINDTIVVFDRIREVLRKKKVGSLGEAIDLSVNQTLTRSINTSFTTFLAVLAILLFGGASLKVFITTLLIGVLVGTYSSIFLASPVIYLLDKDEKLSDIGHN